MDIRNVINGLKLKGVRALGLRERLGKVDLGILKVAFMVAALDGEVTEDEYEAFDALAKKCRGYTPAGAAKALDEAMRSAGYLMLLAKRVKTDALKKAFIAESRKALPDGFEGCPLEDLRRAIVTWIAVGLSDGDYSARERVCIEALRREFAEGSVRRAEVREMRCAVMSPAFRSGCVPPVLPPRVTKDFVTCVEEVASELGDSKAAVAELKKLIASAR